MKKSLFVIALCLFFLAGCSKAEDTVVNYVQAKEKIINEGAILVDVRTQEEYDEAHIDGAVLLTLDTIDEDSAKDVIGNKDKVVIVYCKSGVRSGQAADILKDLGYKNVYNLGAMSNWRE